MKQLVPYVSFNGNCEEALEFYAAALDGEISAKNVYDGSPMSEQVPEDFTAKIMHGEFTADGVFFMAADSPPAYKAAEESNISLSLNFDSPEEQEEAFGKLGDGGTVTMPLQGTFWGAKFGMLKDRFGIHWMFNCDKK